MISCSLKDSEGSNDRVCMFNIYSCGNDLTGLSHLVLCTHFHSFFAVLTDYKMKLVLILVWGRFKLEHFHLI